MDILQNLSLLLARLIMGGMFFTSGKGKVKDIKGFANNNDIPYFIAIAVVSLEILCGLALIIGIFPRVAALGTMSLMCGTMYKHIMKWKSPYWAQKGGWEYDLIWFTMSFIILTTGGGDWVITQLSSFF